MLTLSKKSLNVILVAGLLISVSALAQSPRIEIEGAADPLRENILSHIPVNGEPCDSPLPRLQRLLPQVRSSILEAARALGYYSSTYTTQFSRDEDCWSLRISIVPGEPIVLGTVETTVVGEPQVQAVFAEALGQNELVEGVQLDQGEYERVKNVLSTLAVENGFFSARFIRSEIRLDLVANKADIFINFEPGQRFFFGDITIESASIISLDFIRNMVPFSSGDPYSSSDLIQLRQDLDKSQYFRQISISPQLAQSTDRAVPVNIGLVARPRHAYSVGLGFTTDTGPRVRLAYENRYLNSRGHQISSDDAFSPVSSQLNVNYRLPLANAVRESLTFGAGFIQEDTDAFKSDRFKLESAYNNESSGGWLRSIFINHQQDDYVINTEQNQSTMSVLGANISRTQADDLINPQRGWRLFTEVKGAADSFISDVSFLQLYGSGKTVVGSGRSRLIARLEAGTTWVDVAQELPVSLRFFAGGDQSIRGYKYQTQGPVNDNDEVVGGKHILVAGLEYDFRFMESWRLAVFYDAGNAFSDPSDFDWKQSVGFGVRWLSPIGPIRLDIAHPLQSEESFRLHITMGPDL